jgi:hypothetical protein
MSQTPEFTKHAKDMLIERNITEEWVWRTINAFDKKDTGTDNNTPYLKAIDENEGRILRVVVNSNVEPNRIVTVFFDRRLQRKK